MRVHEDVREPHHHPLDVRRVVLDKESDIVEEVRDVGLLLLLGRDGLQFLVADLRESVVDGTELIILVDAAVLDVLVAPLAAVGEPFAQELPATCRDPVLVRDAEGLL